MAWNACYYNAIEHILWEPQRYGLRHDPDPKKKQGVYRALKTARAKEKPLNDILEIFFALAPSSFTRRLFGVEGSGRLVSVNAKDCDGHSVGPKTIYGNLCQPDLFFVANGLRVAVEIKVADGRPRLEQILKYAALLHEYPHESSQGGRRRLVLMGEEDFGGLWKADGFKTESELRVALAAFTDTKRAKQFAEYGLSLEAAKEWATEMEIDFVGYSALSAAAHEEAQALNGSSVGDEVYAKLIRGLLSELSGRFALGTQHLHA